MPSVPFPKARCPINAGCRPPTVGRIIASRVSWNASIFRAEEYTLGMKVDLAIPGYTIKAAVDGTQCGGVHHSHNLAQPEIGNCPTNPIFAIYKSGSDDPDYRCWKHFREFIAQNPNAVADIIVQLLLQELHGQVAGP